MTIFASGRGAVCRPKTAAGGGAVSPSIIGTPTENPNSTDPHTTNIFNHTVTADTELVLVAAMIGGDAAQTLSGVVSNLDGAFTVVASGPTGAGATASRPGWAFAILEPTTAGAHQFTCTFAGNVRYSEAIAINIKDIDAADPIGGIDTFSTSTADANTASRSVTVEELNSLLLTFGCAQGADTDPFTADLGAALIDTGDTGGGSTSLDGGWGYAQELMSATGAVNYGFSWASVDGWGIAAVEVRAP